MRFILIAAALVFISGLAANEDSSFEKSLQSFGKKLDEAKAKGEKLGQEAKKEWKEIQAKTEEATEEAAAKTEEKGKDWGTRVKGAFTEFGAGVKNAWRKLKGDS